MSRYLKYLFKKFEFTRPGEPGLGTTGVTLVELLVAVGLFGVLSAGLSQVFVGFMEQNTRNEREIQLNESLREFSERLDLELGNLTQLLGCSCGVSRCVYNDDTSSGGIDCAAAAGRCGTTLLLWETETSQSPGSVSSSGNCNGSTAVRGCKKFRKLVLTRPTATVAGKIEIQDAISGQPISGVTGVTQVFCGRTHVTQTTGFKIRVRAKSRNKNTESWSLSAPSGKEGIHRELSSEVNLRNLNASGVHFGNSSTIRNCIADGSATNDSSQCCSNYRSSSTGRCLKRADCKKSGDAPDATLQSCCSHQTKTDSGGVKCL